MSICIKDLFDYDLVKKCCGCKNILTKSNFHKNKNRKDGLQSQCKLCRQKYYIDNRERLIDRQNFYDKQNRDRKKEYFQQNKNKRYRYEKNRRQSDLNFKIACNLRSRTSNAFKAQNIRKTNKTFDLLRCSPEFFRRWIVHQLYGDMTEENYGKVWCLDHCYPLAKCNLNDKKVLYRYNNWNNIRPLYIKENIIKRDKIDHRLYLLQQIKAKYFLKINNDQKGLNEDLHR